MGEVTIFGRQVLTAFHFHSHAMKTSTRLFGAAAVAACVQAYAQTPGEPAKASYEGNVFRPAKVEASDARVAGLRAPGGFAVTKYAENLGKPRMLAVAPNGDVYVSDRDKGTVSLLRYAPGTGKGGEAIEVARAPDLHGLAIMDGKLYIAAIRELYVADIRSDGTLGELKTLYDDLPDAGQHPNRTLRFGPDKKLYLSIGSTCNACDEPNPESATIVQVGTDGAGRRIFAKGLRNTIGFDWHPATKEMYGFDHGIDWLGDEQQKEELNLLKEGADYGWPYIFESGKFNVAEEPPPGMSFAEYAQKTTAPVQLYTAHASPLGLVFYTGDQFPAEYRNDAFVTMRGSWNRAEPSGYKVVRVRYDSQGRPVRFEDFVGTWLTNNNQAHFGRITGIAQHADGSLLIADDSNGVIYRVAYTGR